jgi:hypothetical protein
MSITALVRALAFALLAVWSTSTLEAWQDLRELLTKKLEYDDVVRLAEEQIARGQGDKKELMALEGYAYYLKGKLLLASFTSCAELDALYYTCKQSGISKGAYFSFFQGIECTPSIFFTKFYPCSMQNNITDHFHFRHLLSSCPTK